MRRQCGGGGAFPDAADSDHADICDLSGNRQTAMRREKEAAAGIYDFCQSAADIWKLFDLSGIYFFADTFQTGEGGTGKCDSSVLYFVAAENSRRGKGAGKGQMAKRFLDAYGYDSRMPLQHNVRFFVLYAGDDVGIFAVSVIPETLDSMSGTFGVPAGSGICTPIHQTEVKEKGCDYVQDR